MSSDPDYGDQCKAGVTQTFTCSCLANWSTSFTILSPSFIGQVAAALNAAALRREKAAALASGPRAAPEPLQKRKKEKVDKEIPTPLRYIIFVVITGPMKFSGKVQGPLFTTR